MSHHAFTSITANYLPKARILAESLKQHNPDLHFHLVLCDTVPKSLQLDEEPFDSVIPITELPIPDLQGWIYKHSRVELCTAVKGYAFLEIMSRFEAEKIFFFDPDIVVLDSISGLVYMLDTASILLTPHQTKPEQDREAIVDNEICSLKHGIYNLGFLGVRNNNQGLEFLHWWKDRLHEYCYDDKPGGLFTDQRWIDLAPAFFEDIHIVRDPEYNVATWNLTHRKASGSLESGIMINGRPLVFFHFSGIDSGDQKIMLKKYIGTSAVLIDLRRWYVRECVVKGQNELGKLPFFYATYDNGETIGIHEKLLYRTRRDLQKKFPNPFSTKDINCSYFHWYQANVPEAEREMGGTNDTPESQQFALSQCRMELNAIHRSRSWKLVLGLNRIYRILMLR